MIDNSMSPNGLGKRTWAAPVTEPRSVRQAATDANQGTAGWVWCKNMIKDINQFQVRNGMITPIERLAIVP